MALMTRLVAISPVLAGIAWAGATAVETGTAGAIVFEVGNQIDLQRIETTPAQYWQGAHDRLLGALSRTPADPAIYEYLGVVDSRRGAQQPEYLAEGAVHFSKALELRPSSSYSWANLAAVNYRMGETGPRFETAIVRAAGLGPREPEVQRIVANFGLAVWDEVSPRTRTAIEGMVASGMKRKPLELLQIADNRGRLAVACRHLPGSPRLTDPKWSQLCQSVEAS